MGPGESLSIRLVQSVVGVGSIVEQGGLFSRVRNEKWEGVRMMEEDMPGPMRGYV